MKHGKTVVIIGTLDTKGTEVDYLRKEIERKGHKTLVIDPGVLNKPTIDADFTREQVAKTGGRNLKELIVEAGAGADRLNATRVMIKGVAKIVSELYTSGKLDGIISLGGSTGTAIGSAAMKSLPMGVPKVSVSTKLYPDYVGDSDITVMQTPADIMGLNFATRRVLSNAAGAIVGMVEADLPTERGKQLVGMTALGVTTSAVLNMQPLLHERGFETIVFHSKSEVLDHLVEENVISSVIDVTSFEWIRIFIYPGMPERKNRLGSTLSKGIPLVIVPGGLDMIILKLSLDEIPDQFKSRKLHRHGPLTTLIRTNKEEMVKVARIIAEKANQSSGPVAILVPLRGFSEVDRYGQSFYDPDTDAVFINEVKNRIAKKVLFEEVDSHINDIEFANRVIDVFDRIHSRGCC